MISRSRMSKTVGAGALAVIAVVATACSSGEAATTVTADDAGLLPIRVSTLGLCNEALPWGVQSGIFAEYGLDVELVTMQSGAAGIAALQAGEVDVAFVNPLSAIQAVTQGVKIEVASGGDMSTPEANAVVVDAKSGITEPKQLQGKKVGINQIGGLGNIMTAGWIARDAGSASTAEFVTLPFADMVPSVLSGSVAASQVTASQAKAGSADGSVISLGNPFYDGVGPIPTTVYASTSGFAEANPEVSTKFLDAMDAVAATANDSANDQERWKITATLCKSTPELLAQTAEPEFAGRLDMTSLDTLIGLLEDEKIIENFDVDAMVPTEVRK